MSGKFLTAAGLGVMVFGAANPALADGNTLVWSATS
jgi:hypothetical protein